MAVVSPMLAAKAYAAIQNQGVGPDVGLGSAGGPAGSGFAQMVQTAIDQTVDVQRQAESKMAAHAVGKADLVDVVTSVASAEASLETAMAVRDQVISAYQEIMRMPI